MLNAFKNRNLKRLAPLWPVGILAAGLLLLLATVGFGCQNPPHHTVRPAWSPERLGRLRPPEPQELPRLLPGEHLLLYCDESTGPKNPEAAILTTERMLYRTPASLMIIPLSELTGVTRQQKTFSEIFTLQARHGRPLHIEITGVEDARHFRQMLAQRLKGRIIITELPSVASE